MKLPGLSIVFPAYNDANSIPALIAKAHKTGRKVALKHEIIVVNDGSQDNTRAVLQKLSQKYSRLYIVHHAKNKGYGAALRSGFKKTRMAWVFYTDGDGQYDPTELIKLVGQLDSKTDVVNGYKHRRSDSFLRTQMGNLYNAFVHMRYRLPIRDIDCDFRLMRASILKKIRLKSTSGGFPLELVVALSRAGARFKEVPVSHYPRTAGTSQFFRPRHLLATLRDLFVVG